jgi:hypothetical protein
VEEEIAVGAHGDGDGDGGGDGDGLGCWSAAVGLVLCAVLCLWALHCM